MASRYRRLRTDLSAEEKNLLSEAIDAARKDHKFVLSRGELEDYLPEVYKKLDGLLHLIMPESLQAWLRGASDNPLIAELIEIVLSILDANDDERRSVIEGLCMSPVETDTRSATTLE